MRESGYMPVMAKETVKEHTLRGVTEMTQCAGRYVPYLGMGEGQFFIVMQKTSAGQKLSRVKQAGTALDAKQRGLLQGLQEECGISLEGSFRLMKDTVVWLPEERVMIPDGLHIIRGGTAVATIKKERMEPHHHFFSAFGARFGNQLNLESTDPAAEAYLRGEELDAGTLADGYAAVLIDGISAGGVRVRKGRAKNLYPKGLRM